MSHKMRVVVFGKAGCDKCKTLQARLADLLNREEWRALFEPDYCDIEAEDGIVRFCKAECINPQRIPALLVERWDPEQHRYAPLPNPTPGARDPLGGNSRLYQFLGLQTDYSETGRGILTKPMIESVLAGACELAT